MCGICGIATRGETPPVHLVRRMCRTLTHRGPDGEGVFSAPGVGLGMRRLAIIDLETGRQPIGDETGEIQVVFNGEIYNYAALRARLEARGHRFRTRSDTEVIPHLYEDHGLDFLELLNGIFAIALWDGRAHRLLLARDRVGVKPLFYSVRNGALTFGSEVKSILAADATGRELDLQGLDQMLTLEYTASPRTLLRDVRKLPPGAWLTWTRGEVRMGRFWEPGRLASGGPEPEAPDAEWAARLKDVLDRAVARQMVSDVPLGSFLSGGVDSSILVSAMSRASDRPVKTFSIGFRDRSYDELPHARAVAAHCGTDHHEEVLDPGYVDLVEDVVHHMDQPIADFSVFPTLLVSRVAARHVTVALSGDGGDELFAGYDAYAADQLAHATVDLLPDPARRSLARAAGLVRPGPEQKGLRNVARAFLEGAALPRGWQHMRWMTFLSPARRRELYTPEVHDAVAGASAAAVLRHLDNGGPDRLARQLLCDTRLYLPENILVKVDLMGMAASLETRVPYLDNEVLDLAARMPSRLKRRGWRRKLVLREAYASDLPPSILHRSKHGFSIPLKRWLNREWNGLMRDLLDERSLREDGLFNPASVGRWIREHEAERANHSHVLWALMVFQLWKRAFLAGGASAAGGEAAGSPAAIEAALAGSSVAEPEGAAP